jgi:hypothetical protein
MGLGSEIQKKPISDLGSRGKKNAPDPQFWEKYVSLMHLIFYCPFNETSSALSSP